MTASAPSPTQPRRHHPRRSGYGGPMALSTQLERWAQGGGPKTLGSLIDLFGSRSFAVLFVLLLGVPALPLPTGGATHAFEALAALLALQLVAGRAEVWLPARWRDLELAGERHERFIAALTRRIRGLERLSRPRMTFLFHHRASDIVFGLLVIGGSAAAFFAPPFTGLDTLPALGVVLLSLGVLFEDILLVCVGLAIGLVGVLLEILLGAAALHGLRTIL